MKKIPYGISNYKELIEDGYYYVDKTMYLKTLEDEDKIIMCLRPGRFGKSLFTSMIYYYYDINSEYLFDSLFKDTYVYNNLTCNKNNYYILKFDFSSIFTMQEDTSIEMMRSFNRKVIDGIRNFNTHYNTGFIINEEARPNELLLDFLSYFNSLKLDNKLYIIVDEYDNFTNAILDSDISRFRDVVGDTGFVKSFYSTLKEYSGLGVIGKIFVTGICPITLNAMTTGFNIATDISTNPKFNSMIGLTHDDVKKMLSDYNIKASDEAYDIMLKYYDGYRFSLKNEERVFNATLVMYFMKNYIDFNEFPNKLIDYNIDFNHKKIENILKIQDNKYYKEILDEILKNNIIDGELITKFDLDQELTKDHYISLLYYFGYLTIDDPEKYTFKIPNYVMKEVYSSYFLTLLKKEANIDIDFSTRIEFEKEIVNDGSINKIASYVSDILKHGGDRLLIKFDEKYIQAMYLALLIGSNKYNVYSEYPTTNGYVDLIVLSKSNKCKYNIMIEFKYIKVQDYSEALLDNKVMEAKNQINKYSLDERLEDLKKYIVIYVGTELKILEEIV